MRTKKWNKPLLFFLSFILLTNLLCLDAIAEEERVEGYFSVHNVTNGEKIFATARVVNVGDRYLDAENSLFEITKIQGDKAQAQFLRKVDIKHAQDVFTSPLSISEPHRGDAVTVVAKERLVSIYCTHSDESYIPTDGTSSIPHNGGVYKVGSSLKGALEKKGIRVVQSFTSHDPHDAMAYERSRRTALELLKDKPDAVIDVHRDAVPAEEYSSTVHGQPLAQLQLVVGRQNPQMEATDNFAQQIKGFADEKYPGLIKGIFYGKGVYNQDLFPRNILVEAGTYLNHREKAQDGADILADVIATTLYGVDYDKSTDNLESKGTKVPKEGTGVSKTIIWLLGLSVLGVVAYALVSTGGPKELMAKSRQLFRSEYAKPGERQGNKPSSEDQDDDHIEEE